MSQWTSRYQDCGRWLSRSHRGTFGKRRVTQWNCRIPQRRCIFFLRTVGGSVRVVQGSGNARAAASQTDGVGVSIGDHKSVSSVLCGLWGQKRLIVISCHRFVVGLVVIDHVILVKCTSHCLSVVQFAQSNLEIGQHSNSTSLNICATFSKMTDFEMDAFLGQAQAGGGSARAGPSSGETGGGRREKRSRCHSASGGRAGDSVSGQRGRTERADRHRVQCPKQWQRQVDSTTNPLAQSRASPKPDAQEQLGPPYVHVWVAFLRSLAATRGLAPEHVAVLKSYWESHVVTSAPVQLAAHVRHCRAKPCKKIEGKEGWTRIVFCLDRVTLPLEGALEAALHLQKGVRKHGPAPRGPLEREAAPNTHAREVERLAHRVDQYSQRMAELLRRGVLEPSMVYAFLMTKGGQQVPQPKSKAKARAQSRDMMSEGAEQTPDVSPLVHRLRGRHSVCEGRNAGTLDCSPKKCEYHGKADRRLLGTLRKNDDFLFYMESVARFFAQRNFAWPLCKDDTYILFFKKKKKKKSSMAPVWMTRQGFEEYLHGPWARLTRLIRKM